MAEHLTVDQVVAGSIPVTHPMEENRLLNFSRFFYPNCSKFVK